MANQVLVDKPSIETIVISNTGVKGAAGAGVNEGGLAGQVLAKASDNNFDTVWVNSSSNAIDVAFDPINTSFTAENVQDALEQASDRLVSQGLQIDANTLDIATINGELVVIDTRLVEGTELTEAVNNRLTDHISDNTNPHNTTAVQVPYSVSGDVITSDNVQGAITELESALGNLSGGDYLGVLTIVSPTSPAIPVVGNNGDYFFLEVPSPDYTWQGYTNLNNGDYLISNGTSWEHLSQSISETDPVFRASPAFEITYANLSEWAIGYNNSVNNLTLIGDTLRLERSQNTLLTVDLSKYNNEVPSDIALTNSTNIFTVSQVVQANLTAATFSGEGTNITKVNPRISEDIANIPRPLLVTASTSSSNSANVLTQSSVTLNPSTGRLIATSFEGDGANLTNIIENVSIGVY